MKFTNRLNLPEAIVAAVTNDPYNNGGADFSVTKLLKPPRAVALEATHKDELTEDVSERIWSLCGQIGHSLIERAASGGHDIVEKRFFAKLVVDGQNITMSGQADLVNVNGMGIYDLYDWKFTTIYAYKDGVKPEYIAQLNMLRWLAKFDQGLLVDKLNSAPIYRDWSKMAALRERGNGYPQTQIEIIPVEVWPYEKTEAYIRERISLHLSARKELPLCTNLERWADADQWKCKKPGGKRAVTGGVFTNFDEAYAMASANGLDIHHVPAVSRRCQSYCAAAPFCQQWQELQAAETASEE